MYKKNGIDVSLEQVEKLLEENSVELKEEDLDAISGGVAMTEEEFKEYLRKLGLPWVPFDH